MIIYSAQDHALQTTILELTRTRRAMPGAEHSTIPFHIFSAINAARLEGWS